jgi:ATP-dependent protease HslVU (ClpYQ) peptidase subunit
MTIICAMHEPGVGTWIASDTMRGGSRKIVMDKTKFTICGKWAIGVAGYARAADVLDIATSSIAECDSIGAVAVKLRDALRDDGFRQADNGDLTVNYGTEFVVASAGGVWDVDAGFAITPIPAGRLHANGSGCDEAIGAAYAARALGCVDGERIVRLAVEAAISNCQGCGGEPLVYLLRE